MVVKGFSVKTSDGKYEVIFNAYGELHVTRHGQTWRNETGDNFILTLAQDLKAERENVAALLAAFEMLAHAHAVWPATPDDPPARPLVALGSSQLKQLLDAIAKAKGVP